MANFAQNQPVQYKDYVATQPIEAQTLVGVQREQELQAGIQKVNDYYSRVAGVDVLRDSDKQYIQSRLTSAKDAATKSLSGDFSDSRIVSQITGAATQIYKDPVVQNAIISTSAVRSGQAEMETARKTGKNGPSNDWNFNRQVKDYITNPSSDASFNYKYEQYNDNTKEVQNIVDKMIKASGYSTDEAYHEEVNKKTGKVERVLNESTIRNGFKGVKPDQIRAALRANLSPQAWRQFELDGVYQYSNVPDQAFADQVNKHYSAIADVYKEKLRLLQSAPTTSPIEKAKMEAQKKEIQAELDNIKGEYDGVVSTFASGDTDSAKAKLHTINSINNLASSLSYGEVVSQYVGDTPQQMEKWRQDKAQDWKKWYMDYEQKNAFHIDDMTEKRLTREQKDKENRTLGSLGNPLDKASLPSITLERFTQDTEAMKASLDSQRDSFITQNGQDPKSKQGQDWYNARVAAYESKSPQLNGIEIAHFNAIAEQQREHDGNVELATQLKNKYENSGNYKKAEDFIPKGAPSVFYQEDAHHTWTFTPKDFVEFNEINAKYRTVDPASQGGTPSIRYDWDRAKKELSAKQYKLLEISSQRRPDTTDAKVQEYITHYNENVNIPHFKELAKMGEDMQKELNDRILVHTSATTGIPLATPAQKNAANNLLSELATNSDKYGGSLGDTDIPTLLKLSKDEHKTLSLETLEGNKYQSPINDLVVTGSDGSRHVIPLTDTQKHDVFGTDFDPSPVDKSFAPIEQQITKAGGFSTQLGPKPYLGKLDFPSVQNYGIQANVKKGGGGYILELSIFDPVSNTWTPNIAWPPNNVTDKSGIVLALSQLNDTKIFNMLHENKTPTAEETAELKKAAQKHF